MDLFYQSITVELLSDEDTGYITYSHLDLAKLVIEEQKVNSREEKIDDPQSLHILWSFL